MSPGPRIVFTRFPTGDSSRLAPWTAHLGQVVAGVGPAAAVDSGDGVIVWQLVSANNRHLARSVAIHGSFTDATANARDVIASSSGLSVELVSQPTRGSYGWYALDGDTPVMLCARWYLTPRDRRHSITLALRSLDEAELHPGVRLVPRTEGVPEPLPV